jgi:REP element-mobilizing transposase RayT
MSNHVHLFLEIINGQELLIADLKKITSQPIVKAYRKIKRKQKDFLLDFLETEKTQM